LAGVPLAEPLIEQVVSVTVPLMVIVPSAALAPAGARLNTPPVAITNAEIIDFIACIPKD
jgi:hypothetical protein